MVTYGSFAITHIMYWSIVIVYTTIDLSKESKARKYSTRPNDSVDKIMLLKVSIYRSININL